MNVLMERKGQTTMDQVCIGYNNRFSLVSQES